MPLFIVKRAIRSFALVLIYHALTWSPLCYADVRAPLVIMPCMENNPIVLTREKSLSVYGDRVGNDDHTTDSFRVFPFYVTQPARVGVHLYDSAGIFIGSLAESGPLDTGEYYTTLSYGDVAGLLPQSDSFILRVEAGGQGEAAGTRQILEAKGYLVRYQTGLVLGRIMTYNVSIHRGILFLSRSDMELKGRGPSMELTRSYQGQMLGWKPYPVLGQGWNHTFDKYLHVLAWGDTVTPGNLPDWVTTSQGRILPLSSLPLTLQRPRFVFVNGTHFKRVNNQWIAACGRHGVLEESESSFVFIAKDGTRYTYPKPAMHGMAPGEPSDKTRPMLLANLRYTLPAYWPFSHIEDRNGNRITAQYVPTCTGPMLASAKDDSGRSYTFEYEPRLSHMFANENEYTNHPFRLTGISGPDGMDVAFDYDPGTYQLVKATRDVRSEQYTYEPEAAGSGDSTPLIYRYYNLAGVTDSNGHMTRYTYCSDNDIPQAVRTYVVDPIPGRMIKRVVYPDDAEAVFCYDDAPFNQRTVYDMRGNPTTYILNAYGNPIKMIEPLNKITEFTWQLDHTRNDLQMTAKTDHLGWKTLYDYDVKGNVTREKNDNATITWAWLPEYSEPLLQTRNGRTVSQHRYDNRGNCIETMDDKGKTLFEYNNLGDLITQTNENGLVTRYTYDTWGNIKEISDNQGSRKVQTHDIRGRLLHVTYADGGEEQYTFDTLDRITYSKKPNEPAIKFTYDPEDNLTMEAREHDMPIYYTHNSRNMVTHVRSGIYSRAYTYDANGNLISDKPSYEKTQTYAYNALDEEISSRYAARPIQLRYKNLYSQLTEGLTLPPELADSGRDERQKANKAEFLNRKGVLFYNKGNYDIALNYFTQAIRLSNHSATFILNALNAYYELGQSQEAVDFLALYLEPHKDNASIRAWQAWFLLDSDHDEKSLAVYKELFANGYRDEDDFATYTKELFGKERFDDLDLAFETYLAHGRSDVVLMDQARLMYKRKKFHQALEILEELQKGKAFDQNIAHAMIRNYTELRQYDKARGLCMTLIERGFTSTETYYLKGDVEYMMEWLPEAKKSLEQALALSPDEPGIKSYIDHISGRLGRGDNSLIKTPIDPVPMPPAWREYCDKTEQNLDISQTEAYYTYRLKCYRFDAGTPMTYTVYKGLHIVNTAGVSRLSTLKVSFNPLSENIYVNSLVVKDKTGHVISTGNPKDYYLMDTQPDDMATYDQTLYLPVSGLAPDTTVDLVFTVKTKGPQDNFPFKREVISAPYPVVYSGLFVQGDTGRIAVQTEHIEQCRNVDGGWLWVTSNQMSHDWEPEQVDYERILPIVYLSAKDRTWHDEGLDYYKSIESRLTLDEKTRELARNVIGDAVSTDDKILRLTEHVQKEITYKPLEFGTRGTVPNPAEETLEKKYGDCKDHAVLLHQLLTAVNIPSQLALVDTDWSIRPDLPSSDQFNHMIVSTGKGKDVRFIDPTFKGWTTFPGAPSGLAERKALILDPDNIRLEPIPAYTPRDCKITSTRDIAITDQNTLDVTEDVLFQGYFAGYMRSSLKPKKQSDHLPWAQRLIGRHNPNIVVQSISVDNLFDITKDLTIHLNYTITHACEQVDQHLLTTIPSAWEDYYIRATPCKDRTADFEILFPLSFESRVEFHIPPGYEPAGNKPAESDKKRPYCSWITESHRQDASIGTHFAIQFNPGIYPARTYGEYQQAMERALKSVNRKMVLKEIATPRNMTSTIASKPKE